MMASDAPLVFGFARRHRVGSICGDPCEQCGGKTRMVMTGRLVESAPLFIVREATWEEYVASVAAEAFYKQPPSRETKPTRRAVLLRRVERLNHAKLDG